MIYYSEHCLVCVDICVVGNVFEQLWEDNWMCLWYNPISAAF